jgi:ABC-type transporter Mla subunit MlaD
MAIPVLGTIWQLARRVEDIFQDVAKLVQGLAAARDELRDLERRLSALEGREELLIEKARSAAGAAASSAVTQSLVDMSRRIGALEERSGGQRRIE